MKLLDIVKTVGSAVVRSAVPGGGLLLDAVNELLPDDKKLPGDATGEQVRSVVESLPPEQRAAIMGKEFDVDITQIRESNETVREMLRSDAANPHTTRPRIALGAFRVVAFAIIVTVGTWAYGVLAGNDTMVTAVVDGWPFVLAVIGPLVTLLWAYFGVLKQEHRQRMEAARGGSTPSGLAGIISAVINRR